MVQIFDNQFSIVVDLPTDRVLSMLANCLDYRTKNQTTREIIRNSGLENMNFYQKLFAMGRFTFDYQYLGHVKGNNVKMQRYQGIFPQPAIFGEVVDFAGRSVLKAAIWPSWTSILGFIVGFFFVCFLVAGILLSHAPSYYFLGIFLPVGIVIYIQYFLLVFEKTIAKSFLVDILPVSDS